MRHFLGVGAWGDMFDSVGRAKRFMRENPSEAFGMIHYGFDKDIAVFLKEQGCFAKVKNVQPFNKAHYQELIGLCSREVIPVHKWVPQMIAGTGVSPSDVVPVQIHDIGQDRPVERWYGAKLPNSAELWAQAYLEEAGLDEFYLIQPISLQSTGEDQHWPFWGFAIKWLLECTYKEYVLVGKDNISTVVDSKRLKNISGYTNSMMEVYALANRARGIITTINSMSMWSVINNIPAICVSHKYHYRNVYFDNWIKAAPNSIVEYDQGIDVFSTLVSNIQ